MVLEGNWISKLFSRRSQGQQRLSIGEREILPQTQVIVPEVNEEFATNSARLTWFIRDLHAIEGEKRGGLVDFDLAPLDERSDILKDMVIARPTKDETAVRFQKLRAMRKDLATADRPTDPEEGQQYDFLERKLLAMDTFTQRKNGSVIDFHNYIELTQGFTPEVIPESILTAQLEVIKQMYSQEGVQYNATAISEYRKKNQVPENELEAKIKYFGDNFLSKVSEFIGENLNPNYTVEAVSLNEYWINWADGIRNKFKLKINTYKKRHAGKFTTGKSVELGLHEIAGHFGQMAGWQNSIDKGELIAALGITSVVDPEQVSSEGIAQTIYHFVPGILNRLTDEEVAQAELEIEQNGLRQMVYHNVHIWLNTIDLPEESVVEYVRKYLPAEKLEDIRRHIHDRTIDDKKASYLMSYGMGFYLHREYSLCLNTAGKRELLRFLYSRPVTPQQEYEFVMSLINDSENKLGTGRIPFEGKVNQPDSIMKFPEIELNKAA